MKTHYLEIVTPEVDGVCAVYASLHGIVFEPADARLGGARTAKTLDGTMIGIRAPMHESEESVVRPYFLVDDIEAAISSAEKDGCVIAHPPLELPGLGLFAIYIQGGIHHGLWQIP